jgi:hypothetical protein
MSNRLLKRWFCGGLLLGITAAVNAACSLRERFLLSWHRQRSDFMRRTLLLTMVLATTATTTIAQAPRKKACELLAVADVEAVMGVSPLQAVDLLKQGDTCTFQKEANRPVFNISVVYTDAPDPDAVIKWLKTEETQTYNKARPAAGIGDAAYFAEQFGNQSPIRRNPAATPSPSTARPRIAATAPR